MIQKKIEILIKEFEAFLKENPEGTLCLTHSQRWSACDVNDACMTITEADYESSSISDGIVILKHLLGE